MGTTLGATGGLQLVTTNTASIFINTTNVLSGNSNGSTAHRFRCLVRQNSTNCEYRAVADTVISAVTPRTATSVAMPNNNVWLGRASSTSYSSAIYEYAYFGAFLTNTEMNTLNSIIMSVYGAL